MNTQQTSDEFITYYDELYNAGYMDEWEESKKNRILTILKSINLPNGSKILDFGCGTGVFSSLLKNTFPNCDVVGCEITEVALQIAKLKHTNCTFITNEEVLKLEANFDFVFTHHVLEHVPSIVITLKEISNICKEKATILHILPCGNLDSYEYNLTKRVENGINKEVENRFFYEDPSHLRRLTSDDLIGEMSKHNFKIITQNFANQYYGAISWITKSNISNIFNLTDYKKSLTNKDAIYLLIQRIKLISLYLITFIPKYFLISSKVNPKKLKHILFLILFAIPFIFCYPIYWYVERLAKNEWEFHKEDKNGSEMFLLFSR